MKNIGLPTSPTDIEAILRVLIDEHRQQSQVDAETDADARLSFQTSVAEWREACNLVGWRKLGRALNAAWRVAATDAEWRTVLEPARKRTLLDVCRFLAERTQLPTLAPSGTFGAACLAAGAFVGIRAELAAAGIDVRRIRPSTELDPYLRRAPWPFVGFAARTAPGRLPAISIRSPLVSRCSGLFMLAWLGAMVAAASGLRPLALGLSAVGALAWLCTLLAARLALPQVRLGPLKTFRDYAECLAGQRMST